MHMEQTAPPKTESSFRLPIFVKSIRFQLTMVYSVFLVWILIVMNIGIYSVYTRSLSDVSEIRVPFGDMVAWQNAIQAEREESLKKLRDYSVLGTCLVLVVGAIGGYFIATRMLRPVDEVSSLASRISDTNLKERIKRSGPDDEIKRLADTFDGMLERLENSFELQKQFIQDASHELRTPLAIAQTNIEVLEMEEAATKEDYQQLVDLLKMSLERIKDVSNSLLLLSDGTALPSQMTQVDIQKLISEVYDEMGLKVRAAGLRFDWQSHGATLPVRGDALRLKQVVINLVDNAVKYNSTGGMVKIEALRKGNSAIIAISDSGIGIPAADLPHIFDRFFRVDKSRSRERGGSGLGLAIVKKIVEDHGGTVTAQSPGGQGSVFRIKLPLWQH